MHDGAPRRDLITAMAVRSREQLAALIPDCTLPLGERPTARIAHRTVGEDEAMFENLRMVTEGMSHRAVAPGTYTVLIADDQFQMSDTPAEKRDHEAVVRAATGDCLVMGLGLGMVAQAMAFKPEVRSITVIERNRDVIDLVAPHLSEKVTVLHDDALEWTPPRGQKWDVIWHDIWPSISLDDRPTRTRLLQRYARKWRVFHGAWAQDEIRREAARERNRSNRYW